jgi:hypothetical protein
MKTTLLLLFVIICVDVSAQEKYMRIEAEAGGTIALQSYTNDNLVPPKRQGKPGSAEDSHVNAYYFLPLKGSQIKLRLGIGFMQRDLYMNKQTIGDILGNLFSWDLSRQPDRFGLKQVHICNQYLNVPIGFSHRLTKGKPKTVEFHWGLQFNNLFRMGTRTEAKFDSAYVIPTLTQKKQVETEYNHTSASYLINMHPRIDMNIRVIHHFGFNMQLQPLIFYFNSSNRKLVTSSVGFTGLLGLFYEL